MPKKNALPDRNKICIRIPNNYKEWDVLFQSYCIDKNISESAEIRKLIKQFLINNKQFAFQTTLDEFSKYPIDPEIQIKGIIVKLGVENELIFPKDFLNWANITQNSIFFVKVEKDKIILQELNRKKDED